MKEYIENSGLDAENKPNGNKKLKTLYEMFEDVFFQSAVDALYFWLGIFTYLYFFTIAFFYLAGLSFYDSFTAKIVSSLAEPYLGAVAIYTILKEARKRNKNIPPRHLGEIFVILWLLLLLSATFLALFTKIYVFDETLGLIIKLALSSGIIYIGGIIHKP
ncbi:MAG: hypothetical protein AAB522_02550 [Patescibacteria group bacterium]